jgi:hypothetical protein
MRALDNAAVGIARGVAALEGAAGRIAARSVQSGATGPTVGDDVGDFVTLSTAVTQVKANVVVARTAAEMTKTLLDMFA